MGTCNFNDFSYNKIGDGGTYSASNVVSCTDENPSNFSSYVPSTYTTSGSSGSSSLITGGTPIVPGSSSGPDGSCCYIVTVTGTEDAESESCNTFQFTDTDGNISFLSDISQAIISNDESVYDGSTVKLCGIRASSGVSSGVSSIASSIGGDKIDSLGEKTEKKTGVSAQSFGKLLQVVLIVLASMIGYVLFVLGPHLFWIRTASVKETEICNNSFLLINRYYNSDISSIFYYPEKSEKCVGEKPEDNGSNSNSNEASKCIDYNSNIDSAGNRDRAKSKANDLWYGVEKLYWGFPYNLINKDREAKNRFNQGWVSVVFVIAVSMIFVPFPWIANSIVNGNLNKAIGIVLVIFLYIVALFVVPFYPFLSQDMLYKKLKEDVIDVNYDKPEKIIGVPIITIIILSIGWLGAINETSASVLTVIMFVLSIAYIYAVNEQTITLKNNQYNIDFHNAIGRMFWKGWQGQLEGFRHSTVWSRSSVNRFLQSIGKLAIKNPIFVIFGQILFPIIDFCLNVLRYFSGVAGGYWGMLIGEIKDKDTSKFDWPQLWCSMFVFLPIIGFIMPFVYAGINSVFFAFSYHLVPLLFHAKDVADIITCNLKYLVPVFGFTLIITLWGVNGEEQFLPKNILAFMTVTFVIYTIFSLFFKD